MDKATPKDVFQANRDRAAPLLAKLKAEGIGHIIDGKVAPSISGQTFETKSPIDGAVLASVARGNAEDIDRAATAASLAFKSWRDMPATMRKKLLHRVADAIEDRADDIAVLECIDTGQAHRFMAKAAIRPRRTSASSLISAPKPRWPQHAERGALEHFDEGTDRAGRRDHTVEYAVHAVDVEDRAGACRRLHGRAQAGGMVAGDGGSFGKARQAGGRPDGVLNTVHGIGEEAGKALTEHPRSRQSGSSARVRRVRAIMAQGAPTLKRVHFELGGKNPVIVFDDADLDRALDAVVFMIYSLNGERCTSSSRLLVQHGVAEQIRRKAHGAGEGAEGRPPPRPRDRSGSLIHERHLAKVCSYFDVAQKDGATIAVGGKPHDGPGGGHYVQPTLVTGAHSRMRIAQEEVFGPFLTVIPFRDEKDAIEIANGVQYGLTGYVWTGDMGRALRVADELEAGMIWLNSENVRHLPTPFGGMKSSGIGRDGGDYSFDFYMETKHVSLARGRTRFRDWEFDVDHSVSTASYAPSPVGKGPGWSKPAT